MSVIWSMIKLLYRAIMTVYIIEILNLFSDNIIIITILVIGYIFVSIYDFVKEVDDLDGKRKKFD